MPHPFIKKIQKKAHLCNKHIVLPEALDERVLKATEQIIKKEICKITLLGASKLIKEKAKKLGLKIDWKKVNIEDPKTSKLAGKYANALYELRKEKGMKKSEVESLVRTYIILGQ